MYYVKDLSGTVYGPYSTESLKKFARLGTLKKSYKLSRINECSWFRASELADLFPENELPIKEQDIVYATQGINLLDDDYIAPPPKKVVQKKKSTKIAKKPVPATRKLTNAEHLVLTIATVGIWGMVWLADKMSGDDE